MIPLFGQIIDRVLQPFLKQYIEQQNTVIAQKYEVPLLNQHLSLYITSTDHSADRILTLYVALF